MHGASNLNLPFLIKNDSVFSCCYATTSQNKGLPVCFAPFNNFIAIFYLSWNAKLLDVKIQLNKSI